MLILKAALLSLFSLITLFLLTKLEGNRQLAQISLFDYVNSITIGSIAAEMATEMEESVWVYFTALAVYGLASFGISWVTNKSLVLRGRITGRPLVLFDEGVFFRGNLTKARLDVSEFLMMARGAGYFNFSQVQCAVLEHNGQISFLPRAQDRPLTPADMHLAPEQEYLPTVVVMDGQALAGNLKSAGKDEKWLLEQLDRQGYRTPKEVFLATLDKDMNLTAYPCAR